MSQNHRREQSCLPEEVNDKVNLMKVASSNILTSKQLKKRLANN